MGEKTASLCLAITRNPGNTMVIGVSRDGKPEYVCYESLEQRSGFEIIQEFRIQSELFAPVEIREFYYSFPDSLESLAHRSVEFFSRGGKGALVAAAALWACCELDLTRFARDSLVRRACWSAVQKNASVEERAAERRFARLNDAMRSLVIALAPRGIVPRSFSALAQGRDAPFSRTLGNAWERFLVPLAGNPESLARRIVEIFGKSINFRESPIGKKAISDDTG